MKKQIIIPILLVAFGSLLIISCGSNAAATTAMKSPVEASMNTYENASKQSENILSQVSRVENNVAGAKAKNTANMLAAFKGETTANAKYAAYSKKAEQEGYHEIALLFKAASTAENIHANNHKAVLEEEGTNIPSITPEYTVKTTKENVADAIKGETYEVTTMYPDFIKMANIAHDQFALMSLTYAYKTEKKHKAMYENAMAALENNTVKSLPKIYYVCPTCGNTFQTVAPKRCEISMTSSEKFIKINSL